MDKLGTTTNRVAVFWNADAPTTIQDQAFLDRMMPVAERHNIQVVFAVYPLKATMAPTTPSAVNAFCSYAVAVMQRYPYVRKVIIGNEPNQPHFWQPIWNADGSPASPAAMEAVLASCYDKLKAFDPTLDVIGVGLSPRGNDNPARGEQLLDLARALDRRARQGVSRERTDGAAVRRVVVALLPERQHRRGRDRLRVAEHGLRQCRARQARALGRLQRDRPAGDRRVPRRSTPRAARCSAR